MDTPKSSIDKAPLVGAEDDFQKPVATIDNETISFSEALKKSSGIAVFVVLGTLFHPMYSIVNNIVLGHMNDETPLAGLGLGALTIGITALSLGICFAFGVSTFMA